MGKFVKCENPTSFPSTRSPELSNPTLFPRWQNFGGPEDSTKRHLKGGTFEIMLKLKIKKKI